MGELGFERKVNFNLDYLRADLPPMGGATLTISAPNTANPEEGAEGQYELVSVNFFNQLGNRR